MEYDIDMSDIQVLDWNRGGIPRPVVSTSKRTSQAVPVNSSKHRTNGEYGIGLATKSYTNQPYGSSYGSSSSSSYGSGSRGSSSQYYYNYSANHHEQPKRIETATSETGQAGWDWIDMDNIEEIDYSKMSTSTPRLDANEGINGSKKPSLSFDDIEEVDYSKPSRATGEIDSSRKRVTFLEPKTLDTIIKGRSPMLIPPPPRLSTNGVEIPPRSPVFILRLAVPKSSLPLSDIILDSESKSIIGSKQGDSKDRKRKRPDLDGSSGLTREENDLVGLLGKSNQRVSSRLYATKPKRRVHNEITSLQPPSTDRSSRDDSLNSSSSSLSSLNINEANVFEEREPTVCQVEEDNYPIIRIRQDIFEIEEDDD